VKVARVRDFATNTYEDAEGDEIPRQGMLIVDMDDGNSFAVRPSGTEPKIKYYLFGNDEPTQDLAASQERVAEGLDALWLAIEEDMKQRLGR
jgi:phosphoglucomutase